MTWKPIANLEMLKARASLNSAIRQWFDSSGALEVEVPVIGLVPPTDPWLDSFLVLTSEGSNAGYLLPSPEPFLKRLMAAYPQPFYSITRGFRCGDYGRVHHPEFSILEWYRPKMGYLAMIKELSDFTLNVINRSEPKVVSYRSLFERFLELNPHNIDEEVLANKVCQFVELPPKDLDVSSALDLLFSKVIEPSLGNHIVTDFPAIQASQEKIVATEDGDTVAKRAELFIDGVEIANGYDELCDANELRMRFMSHNRKRTNLIRPTSPPDGALLGAVSHGMPEAYGVALGIDRLLMVLTKAKSLNHCVTFLSGSIREVQR